MSRFNSISIVSLFAVQSLAFSLPAFATSDAMASAAEIRHNLKSSLVQLQGALSCQMDESNHGQGCTLKLQEAKTGKTFELTHAAGAMRLFQDGVKSVALEGSPDGASETTARIAVVRINAL
ncbi:MAG: hypothetical protein H7222_15975 [Methylotenera sp.]|nr:hypothetical protein [Oligoflexia bacterium]